MSRPWSDLRNLLPSISRDGYNYRVIEEFTGVSASTLSLWELGGKVLDSVKDSGQVSDEVLRYFDEDERFTQLAELRYIATTDRIKAITLVYEMHLDKIECLNVARSHKQHEREKKGCHLFSSLPGDLFAFRYWQEILENNGEEKRRSMISKATKFAVTKQARESLRNSQKIFEPVQNTTAESVIQIQNIRKETSAFRAVPVLGDFFDIALTQFDNDLRIREDPPFGFIKVPDGVETFVVLPSCESLNDAKQPYAIIIEDYTKIDLLKKAVEEMDTSLHTKFNITTALLIVERNVSNESKCEFYLKLDEKTGQLEVVNDMTGYNVALFKGKILFLCISTER
jgi:hypothetical protein